MVTELDKENFEREVRGLDIPVIIDFYSEGCGPCQIMKPVFEQVSIEFEGKVKFAKVNVENSQEISSSFAVSGIPCLIIFKDSKEVVRMVGFISADVLRKKLEEVL